MERLLGIWNQKGNNQNLLEGVRRYEREEREPLIETTISLNNGRLQRQVSAMESMESVSGQSCLAHMYSNLSDFSPIYANESIAVAYQGVIENLNEIWEMLLSMGYSFKTKAGSEILLHSINRYLETSFVSPILAIKTIMKRLIGEFAIMVLFAKEECLVVAQSGYPLFIGTDNDMVYISTDTKFLTQDLLPTREIEDREPVLFQVF